MEFCVSNKRQGLNKGLSLVSFSLYFSLSLCLSLFLSLSRCTQHPCRNDWEPPDKKVDTRKYRAEPKSIFEYEPGKSSVLRQERTVLSSHHLPLSLSLSLSFNSI